MTKREKQLVEALRDMVRLIEGDSGAGANFWDDDERFVNAREILRQYDTKEKKHDRK